MKYNEPTLRYFRLAATAGPLSGAHGRGAAGSREQGTWVQFELQLAPGAPGGPRIAAARFAAFGCPHTIAAAGWCAEHAAGREAGAGIPEPVTALQARFAVPVEKLGRLLVVEDAWSAAAAAAVAGFAAARRDPGNAT